MNAVFVLGTITSLTLVIENRLPWIFNLYPSLLSVNQVDLSCSAFSKDCTLPANVSLALRLAA